MLFTKLILKEPIHSGWSSDKKYHVTDESGKSYLLRVSDISQYDRKVFEFNVMKTAADLGIKMCVPVEIGTCADGVYFIQSWIGGIDAQKVIPTLTLDRQYKLGVESGKMLKKIHTITPPFSGEPWDKYYNAKIDRKINKYLECPLKYEHGELFIDYINSNRHLLKNRPQVLQHGDFHRGNLMMDKNGCLNVIDFERVDYGDPWEDMKAITWDAEMSHSFAAGRINGYFDDDVPENFWRLMALYISLGILSSLPWAIPFGKEQVEIMQGQAKKVLEWYNNMQQIVPIWYSE